MVRWLSLLSISEEVSEWVIRLRGLSACKICSLLYFIILYSFFKKLCSLTKKNSHKKESWALIRWGHWNCPRTAPDGLPEAHLNRHIWQKAQSHARAGPNRGKTSTKNTCIFQISEVEQYLTAPLPIRTIRGAIWELSWPWNQASIIWTATSSSGAIGVQSLYTCLIALSGIALF